MAGELHLLANFRGDYTDAALSAEGWQFGVRFRASNSEATDVGDLPNDFSPAAVTINRDETNWTITGNWRVDLGSAAFFNVDDWLNDQLAPSFQTFLGITAFSQSAVCTRIDAYPIGTNGKAIPAPPYATGTPVSLILKNATTIRGGGDYTLLPPQITPVVSLRTSQIGRSGRGRFFAPAVCATNTLTNGTFSKSPQTSSAAATFLVNASVTSTLPNPIVCRPIITGKAVGYSKYARVNQVRCGDILDTQRRRRRQLAETYSDNSLVYP